ncbi:MAG: hypothetical protein HY901_26280 [Deltaproteobacteria bacterium]|nr:hypothetical protein [Deltaproteobacteria bacterium]
MAALFWLGGFSSPTGAWRALALVAWAAALILAVLSQVWQMGLRQIETSRWWASNGRDFLNLAALGALVAALRGMGFGGPAALIVGASVLLPLLLAGSLTKDRVRLGRLLFPLAALVGTPVALAPARIEAFLRALAVSLAS